MNLLTIFGIFSNLFNILGIGDFVTELFHKTILFFDGIAYKLLAYAFKIFQLMCTLNFNSLYNMISGVLSRIEALVLVFVVYKLGIELINFMLKPDEAAKKGKDILVNIFITAALLLSYNTIFTLFNELSMLIVGAPEGYSYIVLGQIAEITGGADTGLINRVVFGTEEQIPDVGEFVSFSICSTFITYAKDPDNTEPLKKVLNDNGKLNFDNLTNISAKIGKEFDWFPIVGFAAACFMIYSLVKTTIQIGVRAFKLLILQILAPVAIITIIGEGVKGKTFQSFIKKYIAVYTEVFVRMFSLLLVCNFVVKFIRNILDYFPTIDSSDNWTKAIMVALIIVAAFKFAGDIPKFIDDILSTHLSDGKTHDFSKYISGLIGGTTGALAGGISGFIGGVRGGGLGGGFGSIGSGMVSGAKSGAKGKSVADFFKGQNQVRKDSIARGKSVAARGGFWQSAAGDVETAFHRGEHWDRKLADIDRQSSALDALEASEKAAVKDSKMGSASSDAATAFEQSFMNSQGAKSFGDLYSSGYGDVKLGDDKDSYASKMLDYDKGYQKAQAAYDRISSDTSTINAAQADIDSAKDALYGLKQSDFASEAEYNTAREAAQTRLSDANTALENAKSSHAAEIESAKEKLEEARSAAEKRAKDYYDGRKAADGDASADVRAKRSSYEKLAGHRTYTKDGKTVQASSGKARTDERRRIHEERAAIQNTPSYQRTHGQNPKN